MQGAVHSVYLDCLCGRNKVNSPDVLFIRSTFEKYGVQIVIDIFFKFFVVFVSDLSKTVFDKFEAKHLMDVEVEIQERLDPLQRGKEFLVLFGKFRTFLLEVCGISTQFLNGFHRCVHIHAFCFLRNRLGKLADKLICLVQKLLIRIDLHERPELFHRFQLGKGIFQMNLILR